MIYSPNEGKFNVKKGPVFANFILADEINRAPGKVQSALLEAMQERQVTIGANTYLLPEPFLVLATQNPLEQEGTYPLPEAQLDRFMLKVVISYPTKDEEQQILRRNVNNTFERVQNVLQPEQLLALRETVRQVYMDEKIERYILDIVFASRHPADYRLPRLSNYIRYGASPRASINLALAAKAYAFIKRRGFVIPEDVRAIAPDVLRHRIGITYEAEADNLNAENIITDILNAVEVP
jgi:MoxR-like ATPase